MEKCPKDYYVGGFNLDDNPDTSCDVKQIREDAKRLIRTVGEQYFDGRRKSAFTYIGEATMGAVKSLFKGS